MNQGVAIPNAGLRDAIWEQVRACARNQKTTRRSKWRMTGSLTASGFHRGRVPGFREGVRRVEADVKRLDETPRTEWNWEEIGWSLEGTAYTAILGMNDLWPTTEEWFGKVRQWMRGLSGKPEPSGLGRVVTLNRRAGCKPPQPEIPVIGPGKSGRLLRCEFVDSVGDTLRRGSAALSLASDIPS